MAERWLAAQCWCGAKAVGVKQVDVLDGYTASCGGRGCAAPNGRVVLGHALPRNSSNWSGILNRLPGGYAVAPALKRYRRGRPSNAARIRRLDAIAAMRSLGLTDTEIEAHFAARERTA